MTFNFRIGWGVQNSSIRLFGLQPGGLQLNPTAESHQVQGFSPIQGKNWRCTPYTPISAGPGNGNVQKIPW